VKKEVVIFITPRLIEEGQNPLSDRHKMIGVAEELDALRELTTVLDVPYKSGENSLDIEAEGENPVSDHRNLTELAEHIRSLQEVVALLNGRQETEYGALNSKSEYRPRPRNKTNSNYQGIKQSSTVNSK
jgi:hypothetical protein